MEIEGPKQKPEPNEDGQYEMDLDLKEGTDGRRLYPEDAVKDDNKDADGNEMDHWHR